jgi:DHA2 family multidrug resistance protein
MAESKERAVSSRHWLALAGVMLGAFMAVLDIQITNSSLNDISGALGSSLDEGSWISTAYLVAEIVVIGTSGIFAAIFSVKRYLMFSTVGFLIFSVLCAFSQNLDEMIIFRALQGITGGALIPLAFNVILTLLPPSKQSIGVALFGMTATFGPSIGPTIGGWLTDNYGWQWIFFINVGPGILMLVLVGLCLPMDKMDLSKLEGLDYFGIVTMAIGLGSLEYVLEEGERKDWFGNPIIVRFSWIAAIFITLFLVREFTARKPFLNLRIFAYRNFTLSTVMMSSLGLGLYGIIYLLPLYLSQVQRYSATQIGSTLVWIGVPQLFIIPFIPKLLKILDVRVVIGVGLFLFSTSCFMDSQMDSDFARPQLVVSNIVRAIGQPLVLIPLLSTATAGLPRKDAGSASALFNMTRNLGGSVGIATLSTIVTRREEFHSVRIGESVTDYDPAVTDRLSSLNTTLTQYGLDPTTATATAYKILNNDVRTQAYILAYSDSFFIVGSVLALAAIALFFLPKQHLGGHAPTEG